MTEDVTRMLKSVLCDRDDAEKDRMSDPSLKDIGFMRCI